MISTSYLVASNQHVVYVRAVGLANMKNAPVLDEFLLAQVDEKVHTVCIDLSECTGMDSTFLGLLVGSSQRIKPGGGKLVIVNPTESNLKLLKMLGVFAVLPVVEGCELPVLDFVTLTAATTMSPLQRMELVKRAHQNLIALNDANKSKFASFLAMLEEDLAKLTRKQSDKKDA